MALQRAPGQGNLPYKPNAFASAVTGIAGMADAYQKDKERRKEQAQDDAIRIFQLAQKDPLVLQTPQASQAFEKAGWPMPNMKSMTPEQLLAGVPKGHEASYGVDPMTGMTTGFKVTPQNRMLDAYRRASIERPIPLRGADGQTYLYFPVSGQTMSIEDLASAVAGTQAAPQQAATAPAQPANPGWLSRLFGGGKATPQVPQPTAGGVPQLGELASQWLAPNQSGAFGPRPTPTAVPSPKPVVSQPNASMQGLQSAMDEAKRLGIPVPMPGAGKRQKPTPAPTTAKEPATLEEFKQTVHEMAKTDRKRAKAYYEKWVSKWQ